MVRLILELYVRYVKGGGGGGGGGDGDSDSGDSDSGGGGMFIRRGHHIQK